MDVSVIVPSYNGAQRLPVLLRSLFQQTLKSFELIIVLDGSKDCSAEVIEQYRKFFKKMSVVNQANKGRAGARNAGVKAANGNLLIFMDDDVRFVPEAIQQHVNHHKKEKQTILVGSITEEEQVDESDVQRYRRKLSDKWQNALGLKKTLMSQPYLSAANFSIEKSVFNQLKGFDERLTDCEDHDLAIRAQEEEIPVYFDPGITGWHDDSVTAHKYLQRLKEYNNANKCLFTLRGWKRETYFPSFFKKAIYWVLSFPFWIRLIDAQVLVWLPEVIRYKLYDAIFFSQSR